MAAPGTIARLWPSDRDEIRDHLLRLDHDDRMLRFGGYVGPARIEAHCDALDWSRALVVGQMIDGRARGIGELRLIGAGSSRVGELAVSVEQAFQDRGIGTALLRRLVAVARNRLVGRLHMICRMDNIKARRLAQRLGGTVQVSLGEAEAQMAPLWPTWWTWLEERWLVLSRLADVVTGPDASIRAAGAARAGGGA